MAEEGCGKLAIFDQNSNLQTLQKYKCSLKARYTTVKEIFLRESLDVSFPNDL